MKRILIVGGGFVGRGLEAYLNTSGHAVTLSEDRITTLGSAAFLVARYVPDVVVNAIGKIGVPNVDWCEDHKTETFFSNVEVPIMLEKICEPLQIPLVHVSSGCIYDGDGPFTEEDQPNFDGSFYSFTKRLAEHEISGKENVLTVRLRIPLTPDGDPRGIISKLMKYDTVIDTSNSVTFMPDFYRAVARLIERDKRGIWNIVNPEPLTYRELFSMYDEVNGTDILSTKRLIDKAELKTRAPRSNTVLSAAKVNAFLAGEVPAFTVTRRYGKLLPTKEVLRIAVKGYHDSI